MPAADFFTLFRFFVRKEFLSKELCAGLRREIAASAHNPATIRSHGSVYTVDLSFRKVQSAEVSSAASSRTESCLLDLKPQIEKHFQLSLSGCQSPQFLEYLPGDFYKPHRDRSNESGASRTAAERRISAVVFLNQESDDSNEDGYSGGSLTFYGLMEGAENSSIGFRLIGEEGLLVAFPSSIVHEVTPVTRGARYTIASWYF